MEEDQDEKSLSKSKDSLELPPLNQKPNKLMPQPKTKQPEKLASNFPTFK